MLSGIILLRLPAYQHGITTAWGLQECAAGERYRSGSDRLCKIHRAYQNIYNGSSGHPGLSYTKWTGNVYLETHTIMISIKITTYSYGRRVGWKRCNPTD